MSHADDWITLPVLAEQLAAARAERRELDARYGLNSQVPDRRNRESGEVAELVVVAWLEAAGAMYRRIVEGQLHNPDFIIGHYAVDVKVKTRVRCKPNYTFGVHRFHLDKPTPWYLFCGYEAPDRLVTIYGAAHRDFLLRGAQLVQPGDVAHEAGGVEYRLKTNEVAYEYPIERLVAPRTFLERVGAYRTPAVYALVSEIQAPGATIAAARP